MTLAAVRGDKTLVELAEQFDLHLNEVAEWRGQPIERAASAIGADAPKGEPDLPPGLQSYVRRVALGTLDEVALPLIHH